MSRPNSRLTIDDSRLETNLATLAQAAVEKDEENFYFKQFLGVRDGSEIDERVTSLNEKIAPAIDCTACGNCCKSLMINVTQPEVESLSGYLQMDVNGLKEKYIETSQEGDMMVINTIPCHFLTGATCSIYEHRFAECRDFPGLHRGNFKERLFATFMHYGRCPIIYNVVEQLKKEMGFGISPTGQPSGL
jgi:Fe-S-cluster containining protein